MKFTGFPLVAALVLALGCGGGPYSTTATSTAPRSSSEFQRLCLAVGAQDGRISRQQFLAQAKDKDTAAQLFDACDVNRDNLVTEEEATANTNYFENLRNQVILFRTTR